MYKLLLHKPFWPRTRLEGSALPISIFICCLLLLNGCGNISSTGSRATVLSVHKSHDQEAINRTLEQKIQAQMQTFQLWIGLMQQFKGDTSQYQQEYSNDQKALAAAKTTNAYQATLQILNQHVNAIKIPALHTEASYQEQQITQQANAWGATHTYHDSYNGTTYPLGYEYSVNGVAGWSHDDLASAQTLNDYQQVVEETNMFLYSFQIYKQNTSDKTPWNQVHQTDLQLMQHYGYNQGKVVVVSLSEQSMRLYDNGKLVKALQVTTGRPEKPSPPGGWQVESKQSPTVFKSDEPVGSAFWYPDTPINYAMLYHSGGYFIHDSWWRDDYGPNTQFPHIDSGGDSFSFDGSHGCVNVSTENAAWIYNFVNVGTDVIVY